MMLEKTDEEACMYGNILIATDGSDLAAKAASHGLIEMGSHGRGGVAAVILGSVTTKVLAHSTIPVLVCT
jgi:nucleotide-binding universal stress UspA family protein